MVKILDIEIADKGYYINLDESIGRKENVENQIEKYGIENLERFSALTDPAKFYSCTKSHLEIFKQSLELDINTLFVLEDDFQIYDECKINNFKFDFKDVLSQVMTELKDIEWDVVMFGCNPKTYLIPETNSLSRNFFSTGSWAYIISKRAYRHILENSNYFKDYLAIDDWLSVLSKKGFNVFTTTPKLISHAINFESTLMPSGKVNYDVWIEGNYENYLYRFVNDLDFVKDYSVEQNITIIITGHFIDNF